MKFDLDKEYVIEGTGGEMEMSRAFYDRIQEAIADAPRCDLCKTNPAEVVFKVVKNGTGVVKNVRHVCHDCLKEVL